MSERNTQLKFEMTSLEQLAAGLQLSEGAVVPRSYERERSADCEGQSGVSDSTGRHVASDRATAEQIAVWPERDALAREVYCVLGIPVDVIDAAGVVRQIEMAADKRDPFFVSTPNLNFLVTSLSDSEFRESLLLSDLCPPDGMPVVWLARLLGIPLRERTAGSDIFEALKVQDTHSRRLTTFLFGAAEGVAAAACASLNAGSGRLACAGFLNPGHGTVDAMSCNEIIDAVNASDADVLAVSLGAVKGQTWLQKNHRRLRLPVRVHLGATINFQAGAVRRAPSLLRRLGLEWAWRIKEEPKLWRRYWHDGLVFLRLIATHVLPVVLLTGLLRRRWRDHGLTISRTDNDNITILHLAGAASAETLDRALPYFRDAISAKRALLVLDVSKLAFIDARFLGFLLMVRKQLKGQAAILRFAGAPPAVRRFFRLHAVDFLLAEQRG